MASDQSSRQRLQHSSKKLSTSQDDPSLLPIHLKLSNNILIGQDRTGRGQSFTNTSLALFGLLVFLSLFTRLYRISNPDAIIFDEVYFGMFARQTVLRAFYFDIHPPLAKLLLGLVAWVCNLDTSFAWDKIGKRFPSNDSSYIALRSLQGFFGAMLPGVGYLTLREMGASQQASFLTGSLILFDLSFQTISRAVLTDSTLYFFIGLSFLLYQRFLTVSSLAGVGLSGFFGTGAVIGKEERQAILSGFGWCLATSIALGCTMCVKWTGVGVFSLIGVVHLLTFIGHLRRESFRCRFNFRNLLFPWFSFVTGILIIIGSAVVYTFIFLLHLKIVNNWTNDGYMLPQEYWGFFSKNGNPPSPHAPGLISTFIEMHRTMLVVNAQSLAPHPWGSNFYEWPVMYRGLVYFYEDLPGHSEKKHRLVYLFGNPFIWWLAFGTVICFGVYLTYLLYRSRKPSKVEVRDSLLGSTLIFGYLVNIFPYLWIFRTVFVYHYHPSLYFAILLVGYALDVVSQSHRTRNFICAVVIIIAIGFYLYFLPFSVAIPLTDDEHKARVWLSQW